MTLLSYLKNPLIALSTLLLAGVGVIVYEQYLIAQNASAIEELQGEVLDAQRTVDRLEELREAVRETAQARQALDRHFLPNQRVPLFLEEFESHLWRTGLTRDDLQLGKGALPQSEGEDVAAVSIRLSATGGFDELLDVLELIERMPYVLVVRQVSLEEQDGGSWQMSLEVLVAQDDPLVPTDDVDAK